MNTKNTLLLSGLAIVLLTSCSNQDTTELPSPARADLASNIQSLAELKKILVPGISTNSIVSRLGTPVERHSFTNNVESWRYALAFLPETHAWGTSYITGALLVISNAQLASWGFDSVGVSTVQHQAIGSNVAASDGTRQDPGVIELYVVETNSIPGGRFVNTTRLPGLGYISSTPIMVITKLKSLNLEKTIVASGGTNETVWMFATYLLSEDAEKLKFATANNIGRRLLVVVNNEPIVAPKVVSPLETGAIGIACDDPSLVEKLRAILSKAVIKGGASTK